MNKHPDDDPVLDFDFRCFHLASNREELCRVVDSRCEQMVFDGLFEETISLYKQKIINRNSYVCKAIGYNEIVDWLETDPKV